jgi:hypothetical protein
MRPMMRSAIGFPSREDAEACVLIASDKLTAAELRGTGARTDLFSSVIIFGAVDSGCTGSLTPHLSALINVRPCDEKFSSADGAMTAASCIGDMPVTLRDQHGRPHPPRGAPRHALHAGSGAKRAIPSIHVVGLPSVREGCRGAASCLSPALVLVGSATACSVETRDVRLFASAPDLPRAVRSALREPP